MKPLDFQGITALGSGLIEDLRLFLQEKESALCRSIVHAIHPIKLELLPPLLPERNEGEMKLPDAVEGLASHIFKIASQKQSIVETDDWILASEQINSALWEYVEVLEGCVNELFYQIESIGFERWTSHLLKTIDVIREMLELRLDELGWKIRRLDFLLKEYREACESLEGKNVWFRKFIGYWKSPIDPSLLKYAKKNRKVLNSKFQKFSQAFRKYEVLKVKIDQSVRKFSGYQIFRSLDGPHREEFKTLYKLLKVWELNSSNKALPQKETIRALRDLTRVTKTMSLFEKYKNAIQFTLFERSRKLKKESNELYTVPSARMTVSELIKGYRAEVHTLGAVIDKYREFLLRTDSNPYIRTRWGFAEWIVGQEPAQTKDLLSILYEVEEQDKLFDHLSEVLKNGPSANDQANMARLNQEIGQILHEMGQPLLAKNVMKGRIEKLLELIQELDELGSFNPEVTDYVARAFSKALRVDWQYHVLFDHPLFHQLYKVHQEILGPYEDRAHINRINKFKDQISQIERWVIDRDTHRHVQEIETDMTDMKGYLQDFLAFVQRVESEKNATKISLNTYSNEISRQLLEYRYLFSKFFYSLNQHTPEGRLIRNQFLFVDQYFETVENKLDQINVRLKSNV